VSGVLVTGARGFAGGYLANLLAETGVAVTGWVRPARNGAGASGGARTPDPFFNTAIRWQDVDLLDRGAVAQAIAGLRPGLVYHCAGAAHVGQSFSDARETLAANVLGTHHLLDALRSARVNARILITGSSLVYRESRQPLSEDDALGPATPYAVSKLAQEMLGRRGIHEDGQEVFLTRPFNHTGARQDPSYAAPGFARQIARIEKGQAPAEIWVGNLDAARDLHDVRDTVRAYRAIVEKGRSGTVYNVCAGQAFTIRHVLDRLIALSRVPVTVRVDPARFRPNDNPVLVGDRRRIELETGWRPEIPLEKTLADLLDYWRREVRE
jgi:GDP-4-dehydro-6-deoxy-D-mannose reductase